MGKELECLWFCRHGETISNQEGWLAGSLDTPLTDLGRHQAEMAGQKLKAQKIERIFSSPLARASETARIISAILDVPVITVPALAERCWGELEGLAFPSDLKQEIVPGGESLTCFYRRVAQAVKEISDRREEGVPLVVAHAGTGQAIQYYYGASVEGEIAKNADPYKICRQLT